ncbi:hypothetical protein [Pseudonocardia endophytica]|uniref:hypothetical protein n=1 Tax=Pseudonocardia endophytica TaxID=401976 RepID=UPI001053B9AD|nr:hypothetical protein [Pseudonocardia endophytica]
MPLSGAFLTIARADAAPEAATALIMRVVRAHDVESDDGARSPVAAGAGLRSAIRPNAQVDKGSSGRM